MKYCPNCGSQNRDNASFCINCGQNLLETAPQQQQPQQQQPSNPQQQQATPQQSQQQQAPQQPQQQYQPQQGMASPGAGMGHTQNLDSHMAPPRPENYMTRSVISMVASIVCVGLLGVIPLVIGILATVQANKVNSLYDATDYQGAQEASRKAKNLSLAALITTGVLFVLVFFVVLIAMAMDA